jgi:hypothetical protein
MQTSFDQGQNWFLRGMRAGLESRQQHPNWTENEVTIQSGMQAVLFLLTDPEGAVQFSRGFIRGYQAAEVH